MYLRSLIVAALACAACRPLQPTSSDPRRQPDTEVDDDAPPDNAPPDDAPPDDAPPVDPGPVDPDPDGGDDVAIDGQVTVFPELPWVPNPVGRLVAVKPLFAVPVGARMPSQGERTLLAKHLQIAQARYQQLLEGQDTFAIESTPDVVTLAHDGAWYLEHSPEWIPATAALTDELLTHYGLDRHRAPFVFVIVVMGEVPDGMSGNGMPLNGGYANGGGAVSLPQPYLLSPNFQSTLQHELGHAFGLPHVDVYGYDMSSNDSIMSYNLGHHTDGLEAGVGELIPEDLFALDKAERVFPRFTWSGAAPPGYVRAPTYFLHAMPLQTHPWEVIASTNDGEMFGSAASHALQSYLRPSSSDVGFDASIMWHAAYDLVPGTLVAVDLDLPVPVALDAMGVHTEHSGVHHRADRLRITSLDDGVVRVDVPITSADARVSFAPFVASRIRVQLGVPASGSITVRGLRFFEGALEVFPPIDVQRPID
ncbi:MAG: hypothetical protein IT383_14530 [Deltaproteobacteria bacterium]|nr:hypothetical protein [Deltaproteobacteria bacterium]